MNNQNPRLETINSTALSPEQAAHLLEQQTALQEEARAVMKELHLEQRLSSAGNFKILGSAALGTMVWRDIDIGISRKGLQSEQVYEIMRQFYTHSRVKQIRFFNETGLFTPARGEQHQRLYYAVVYQAQDGNEWKLDISFWTNSDDHEEPFQDNCERKLTDKTLLSILWLKTIWVRLPAYRAEVASVDIYDAVLEHSVHTPDELDNYLKERGKPTRTESEQTISEHKRYG